MVLKSTEENTIPIVKGFYRATIIDSVQLWKYIPKDQDIKSKYTPTHTPQHTKQLIEQSCHCRIISKMIFLINDAGSTRHLFGVNYYRWIIKQNMSYKTIKLLYSKIKINYLLHIKLQPKHEIKTNEAHKNSWSSWIQYRWQRFHK